jgi:hypothetical protein
VADDPREDKKRLGLSVYPAPEHSAPIDMDRGQAAKPSRQPVSTHLTVPLLRLSDSLSRVAQQCCEKLSQRAQMDPPAGTATMSGVSLGPCGWAAGYGGPGEWSQSYRVVTTSVTGGGPGGVSCSRKTSSLASLEQLALTEGAGG